MLIPAVRGRRTRGQTEALRGLPGGAFQLTARKVAESTKQEGGNTLRVCRKVVWVPYQRRSELRVSDELVGDNLGREKPGDLKAVGRGCSQEENKGPEDVGSDELQSERVRVRRA
jgi:hypothetical protein